MARAASLLFIATASVLYTLAAAGDPFPPASTGYTPAYRLIKTGLPQSRPLQLCVASPSVFPYQEWCNPSAPNKQQQWVLRVAGTVTWNGKNTPYYDIRWGSNFRRYCMTVQTNQFANGDIIARGDCQDNSRYQEWIWEVIQGGSPVPGRSWVRFRLRANPSMCLEVRAANKNIAETGVTAAGLQIWRCIDPVAPNQKFLITNLNE